MFRAIIQNSFLAVTEADESKCKQRARSADAFAGKLRGEVELEQCVVDQLVRFNQLLNDGPTSASVLEVHTSKAVAERHEEIKGKIGLCRRIASNTSVSTMAPEDDDDISSLARSTQLSGLKVVGSSSSLFSMVSDDEDDDSLTSSCATLSTNEPCSSNDSQFVSQKEKLSAGPQPRPPAASRSLVDDFSHCHVPRRVNLAQEFEVKAPKAAPTTLMIRNIPNRHTQLQIMKELESLGFAGTFDFFYAPMDKCTKCTVGYAFVNFLDAQVAAQCMKVMEQHWFSTHGRQRAKQARVSIAHLQGFEANVKHYKDSAVNNGPSDGMRGPVIMPSLARSLGAW